MVALLAIAAAATGPARAQTNTVRWEKYQISGFNLLPGDRETLDDVTLTSNGGTASDNGGDVYFNGAFTFSVPAGSVFTQIVIRDETWLNVGNTGWSRDDSETQATWTGSARSVACEITASNVQYIEFTIASAVPKMYTSEVSITDLVPGDTLVEGATIIGSGDEDDMVFLAFGRTKKNGVVPSFWENLGLPPTVIGTNGTISGTYTPVDENGQDGTAWVVTDAILNDYDGFEVGLGGIRIPGPPHTVRMAAGTEDAANWTLASGNVSVPGDQVLENVMSGSQVTATYNGNRKVKSVKAVKYVAPVPPTPLDNTTTAWADGSFAVPAGGLTYSAAITVSGNVTLVLTDGETLTLNKGISLAEGATLTVEGTGAMVVNGTNNSTASTVAGTGTLVLTSGTLNAKGGNGQGVGNYAANTDVRANAGGTAINGNVTVSGGTLTATGGNGGGVGDMSDYSYGAVGAVAISGNVTITGGAVTATGGNGGSIGAYGISEFGGNGGAAIGGDATITGGAVTATGGNGGSVGDYGDNCNGGAGSAAINGDLTINSGTETLTNGANGQLGQYSDECSAGTGGKAVAGTVTDNR